MTDIPATYEIQWLCPAKNSISGKPLWITIGNGKGRFHWTNSDEAYAAFERVKQTKGSWRLLHVQRVALRIKRGVDYQEPPTPEI